MDTVIRIFAGIAAAQDCAFDLSHHTRKAQAGTTELAIDDIRGASAIRDAVRAVRVLNHMSPKDAEALAIPEAERTAYFRVDRAKGNNSPPPRAATWRKFVNVSLPNTDEVGVVVPWEYPGQGAPSPEMARRGQDAESLFMSLLVQLTFQGRHVSDSPGSRYAPHVFAQEQEARDEKIGKAALAEAMRRLFGRGQIRLEVAGTGSHKTRRIVVS